MKHLLIISFDFFRPNEITKSYSIASLTAYLKQFPEYNTSYTVEQYSELNINMMDSSIDEFLRKYEIQSYDFIALSCYAWSEEYVIKLLSTLKALDYKGKIILGGYQITATSNDDLPILYPDAHYFVKGYAEESLYKILTTELPEHSVIPYDFPDLKSLPSPYLSGELIITSETKKIRWETKRGCTYGCGFCEWGNILRRKMAYFPLERVFNELEYFKQFKLEKINVLDATFNLGNNYLTILEKMLELDTVFALQARFENIKDNDESMRFLELCSNPKIHLEFGLQTIVPEEMATIGRDNKIEAIKKAFKLLDQHNISFEVSLIYGIPNQTPSSFLKSIDFALDNGCKPENISCFPLRIPRNSKLEKRKQELQIREEQNYHIKVVKNSTSFNADEWSIMNFFGYSESIDFVLRFNTNRIDTGCFYIMDNTIVNQRTFRKRTDFINLIAIPENDIKEVEQNVEDVIKTDTLNANDLMFAHYRREEKVNRTIHNIFQNTLIKKYPVISVNLNEIDKYRDYKGILIYCDNDQYYWFTGFVENTFALIEIFPFDNTFKENQLNYTELIQPWNNRKYRIK